MIHNHQTLTAFRWNRQFNVLRYIYLAVALVATFGRGCFTSESIAAEPTESATPPSNSPIIPEFSVYPTEILLDSARDSQSFIAVMTREDGVTLDISDRVEWSVVGAAVAAINAQSLHPLADGAAELVATYNGATRKIPIKVASAATSFPISFEKDVMPVLTRSGCNTGSCHGAARGKDGFRVSLFGFDPAGDYQRITREIGVRRINLAVPEESLFLKKIRAFQFFF